MKTILLTGSPLPSSLSWDDAGLYADLLPRFATNKAPQYSLSAPLLPQWRSLPLVNSHLPTGLPQRSQEVRSETDEPSFFSTSDVSLMSSEEIGPHELTTSSPTSSPSRRQDVLSQYYEHSFAIHEDIPSSQIVGPGSTQSSADTDEYSIQSQADGSSQAEHHQTVARLQTSQVSDLKDMPNAVYLRSINPQTMTVNLVVGIISISQPRNIKPRKGGPSVELIEMIVGDETRAGFGVNLWLSSPQAQDSGRQNQSGSTEDGLRLQALRLRPQDVILAKTIALGSFKGSVYGQSLRRGMTTVDLLYRNLFDKNDSRGAFTVRDLDDEDLSNGEMRKVKRVKEWVGQFVGTKSRRDPVGRDIAGGLGPANLPSLPLDTQ